MNIRKKLLLLFVFLFAFFAVNIDEVYAAGKCVYEIKDPPRVVNNYTGLARKSITIDVAFVDGSLDTACKSETGFFEGFIDGGCKFDAVSDMFVVDDDVLYCPSNLYLKFEGEENRNDQAVLPAWVAKYAFVSQKNSHPLVFVQAIDGAETYQPGESNGELLPCKKKTEIAAKIMAWTVILMERFQWNSGSCWLYTSAPTPSVRSLGRFPLEKKRLRSCGSRRRRCWNGTME